MKLHQRCDACGRSYHRDHLWTTTTGDDGRRCPPRRICSVCHHQLQTRLEAERNQNAISRLGVAR